MADTKKAAAAAPPAAGKAAAKPAASKAVTKKRKRNPDKEKKNRRSLGSGMYKYGLKKRSVWSFVGKKDPKKGKPKRKLFVVKPIGGEKNGGTRRVCLAKKRQYYPTADKIRKRPAKIASLYKNHRRYLRSSLVPGKVVIILTGVHKGHRAIFLKQLESGLLLVTGPFAWNGVPLRRIHQSYVLTTSTQIDISKVEIPATLNDRYFKRIKPKKAKKEAGDIFVSKKEGYKVSDQRKIDQKVVDKQIINVIRKLQHRKLFEKYLRHMFRLRNHMYPHKMKF